MKKKIWNYSGLLLLLTGILHTLVAILFHWQKYLDMIKEGLVNTINDYERSNAFWFLVCGIIIMFFGSVLQHYQKLTNKPAPLSFGCSLLLFSIVGCIMGPVSGFWLFIPQALIIIIGNKKQPS